MARYVIYPRTQLEDWRELPPTTADQDPITGWTWEPYDPFGYDYPSGVYTPPTVGVVWGEDVYRTIPAAWQTSDPGLHEVAYIAGEKASIPSGIATANNIDTSTPLGPITSMFFDDGEPLQALRVGVYFRDGATGDFVDVSGTWTADPEEMVTVTPLDADGSDLGAPVTLASLAPKIYVFWGLYDAGGAPYGGGISATTALLDVPCYGVRMEHAAPGAENPYAMVLSSLVIDTDPATTSRPYLRQRQSPRANPRVSFQRQSLRNRQMIP